MISCKAGGRCAQSIAMARKLVSEYQGTPSVMYQCTGKFCTPTQMLLQ